MKNYEAIKTMNQNEMAAMLYLFLKPLLDGFNLSAEQRAEVRDSIIGFLEHECTVKK